MSKARRSVAARTWAWSTPPAAPRCGARHYPFHPYPFPWTSHLFQDSPSVAMGLFEGHMAKMAEGFKAVRMAEMELRTAISARSTTDFFTRFNWEQVHRRGMRAVPAGGAVGGDGAMYDIGFQNLSRMMMSGKPIKVLVVDTQVYSNTGGQACTSGFTGQVSDMAPYRQGAPRQEEIRKEMSLIGMAHRTAFVLQGSIANVNSPAGRLHRRPQQPPAGAVQHLRVCPPEHGVGDDRALQQSKLAVESRAYPLFRYNPDKGETFRQSAATLKAIRRWIADWPAYALEYIDEQGDKAQAGPAVDVRRFRGHRGALRQAVPEGAARNLERQHDPAGRLPGADGRTIATANSPTSGLWTRRTD